MRSIPNDTPATNRGMSEAEKRSVDAEAARSEHEIVSDNWIVHRVPWIKFII